MEQKRSTIVELSQYGHSQSEILRILKLPSTQRKFVYRTIQRYKETGGVTDRARSGRPTSITTPRLRKVVNLRIQ